MFFGIFLYVLNVYDPKVYDFFVEFCRVFVWFFLKVIEGFFAKIV